MGRFASIIAVLLATAAGAAALTGADATLTTRDGKTHHGRILAETSTGYLLRTQSATEVVEFSQIMDVAIDGAPAGTPAVEHSAETPAPAVAPSAEERHGFRVGVGAGGLIYPDAKFAHPNSDSNGYYAQAALLVPVSYDFGRVGIGAIAFLGFSGHQMQYQGFDGGPLFAVDVQLRVHVSRAYSFGVGVFQGAVHDGGLNYGIGPSLTLVDLALGERRQHDLGLWAGVAIVPGSSANLAAPLAFLSYSFLF
jgi:hypothetical protein